MHGDGIKPDIMTNSPAPARLLDLTRLISRAGTVLTGIDRVELAYLRAIIADKAPCFAVVRTGFGYALLNQAGMAEIMARVERDVDWGPVDRLSRLLFKAPNAVKQAQSDVRRFAIARCRPRWLPKMFARYLPEGVGYFNVGQSNLTDRMMNALRYGAGARISIMIHDTIPLDFPQYQTAGSVVAFRAKLRRVRAWADLVIYNSACTRRDGERHMAQWGDIPKGIVAHLGVEMPEAATLPENIGQTKPYFVFVSTIEPRKNHALLLDIWESFDADLAREEIPDLYICGRRGWKNEAVFARLDRLVKNGAIHEVSGLNDGALAALVQGAAGALFPSLAEGYGLPPIEAAMLGVPVVCGNLDIFREVLGDTPVYVDVKDRYLWQRTITKLAERNRTGQKAENKGNKPFDPPRWDDHFNIVLKAV